MNIIKSSLTALALAASALAANAAPAILDTGLIRMGVGDTGGLGQSVAVGLSGPTGDAITPGCLCEGWGASASGVTGYTYGNGNRNFNFVSSTMTQTGVATGNVVTVLTNGLEVTHTYSSAAGGKLFKVEITMKNTTAGTKTDVRYARTLDWDVTPGFFDNNYTTVYGGTPTGPGGKVLHTSTNPFAAPDPLVTRTQEANTNVVNSIGDKGGYFIFGFGDLAAGASETFTTFIGADDTVAGLLGALGSVGVEAYSYTTGNRTSGATFAPAYGYGFVGLGLPPSLVSAPGTLALAGLGLLAAATLRRRQA